ncbi:small integral membrane protein 12-A-like [Eurosta solidaginis]|uniref:small integral membrane protein 12-A-like n=1 Tax=Eurosta solidaginis TaxID=178769 RepID=UPI0035306A78
MWPILMAILRRNAVHITLPVAAVVGFIGYNLQSLVSDTYTHYSKSIKELRAERLAAEAQTDPAQRENLYFNVGVLERNLPRSLEPKS